MKYVAYYRISKDSHKAGRSKSDGLGIDAQQQIITHYYPELDKVFTEVKSGKNITDRPVLQEAIKYCVQNECALVVAKVDRLSRNVDDCRWALKELQGRLFACDLPGTIDKFSLTLFAAFAERERELISLRTSLYLHQSA